VTDLEPDQAEVLWYGMRSWIEGGFKLLKRGGWQWQATRMTEPDRVERLWLVLAVATRYVLAVGGEADAAEFADAAVPEPSATAGRPAQGAPGRARRRGAAERETPARVPRRRRTGTKQRLVSVFRQGLAVLLSVMIAGHALPKPSLKPEAWLEARYEIKPPPHEPPTPIPKNPSF
jgi:hypothetical protein